MRHQKYLRNSLISLFSFLLILFSIPLFARADSSYGSGTYNSCAYSTACNNTTISISSGPSLSLNVNFNTLPACAAANDNVIVSTNSATGYSLLINSFNSGGYLTGATNISSTSGSRSSPVTLSINTWGYRVDSLAGFGAIPSNYLTASYAAVPVATTDLIAQTSAPATNASTAVWYGVCVDTSIPSGSYTDTIVYTAVANSN